MDKIKIKALRINKGKTCDEMSALLNISRQAYCAKENGKVKFTGQEVIQICVEFDIDARILDL